MTPPAKARPPRIGLALGSGGARGWAHVGVLRRLLDLGVQPACVAGTSAGAIVGAAFAAGRLHALEDLSRQLTWRDVLRLFVEVRIPHAGLVSGKNVERLLREVIGVANIEDLPLPFAAVATDLHAESAVVFRDGDIVDALRASFAIPGIFSPAVRAGRPLVDGGLVNPVPVNVARLMGADIVIAVDVNLCATRATPDGEMPAARQPGLAAIFDILTRSVRVVENQITRSRMAADPPDILVQPAVGDIDFLSFHQAPQAIVAGRRAADLCSDALRKLAESALDNPTAAMPK